MVFSFFLHVVYFRNIPFEVLRIFLEPTCQVFDDGSHVDRRTDADAMFSRTLFQVPVHATHRERDIGPLWLATWFDLLARSRDAPCRRHPFLNQLLPIRGFGIGNAVTLEESACIRLAGTWA